MLSATIYESPKLDLAQEHPAGWCALCLLHMRIMRKHSASEHIARARVNEMLSSSLRTAAYLIEVAVGSSVPLHHPPALALGSV
jgi:hypothetical protein